jgi:hypothetical protein
MQEEAGDAAVACSGDGKPAELDGEDKDEDRAECKVWEGEADEGQDAEGAVLPSAAMEGGGDASGDGESDTNEQGGDGEGEGVGIALEDQVNDRVVEAEGLAEVGVEDAVPVMGVLLTERGVETIGVAESTNVGGGSSFSEHLDDGVAGNEVDKEEDNRHDDPEDWQGEEDASDGSPESCSAVLDHWMASLLSASSSI